MPKRQRPKRRRRPWKEKPQRRPKGSLQWMGLAKFNMEVIWLKRTFLSESKKMFSKLKD